MFLKMEDAFAFLDVDNFDDYSQRLPAGVYRPVEAMFQPLKFKLEAPVTDKYVPLSSETYTRVRKEVDNFFNPEQIARLAESGVRHKRGIIIHGEPGTGKSSFVMAMLEPILANDAVVLMQPDIDSLGNYVESIRKVDPNRVVVVIWDEFDSISRYNEETLLRITDGNESIDNLLIIGMTNYLHNMRPRIYDRPSRFGLVVELEKPNEQDRQDYIKALFPKIAENEDVFRAIVGMTNKRSLDHLKEACVQFCVCDVTLQELALRYNFDLNSLAHVATNEIDINDIETDEIALQLNGSTVVRIGIGKIPENSVLRSVEKVTN